MLREGVSGFCMALADTAYAGSGSCLSDRDIKIVPICALSHRCPWRSSDRHYVRISGILTPSSQYLQ